MKTDVTKKLIETTIHRSLKNIGDNPERAIRNLVDLGLQFSNGRFQKQFFAQAQKMLQNPQSAYYTLTENLVANTRHDLLTTFGLNIGYNSCTKGAKRIRSIEAEKNIEIPWALSLLLNSDKLAEEPDFYPDLLRQGMALGIYTYLLFADTRPEDALLLAEEAPDCAFILFLRGADLTPSFFSRMASLNNTMLSLYADDDTISACELLRDSGLLYAVHYHYHEEDRAALLDGSWLRSVLPAQPSFVLLHADDHTSLETQEAVYRAILALRTAQELPLFCMDIKYDALMIDRIISDGECLAGFDADGCLRTHQGIQPAPQFNIFRHSLEDILHQYHKTAQHHGKRTV